MSNNSQKLTHILQTCIANSIPLDKAEGVNIYSFDVDLRFDATKLTQEELRNLKRVCEFRIEGDAASGYKTLTGPVKASEDAPVRLRVHIFKALSCKKVYIDDLSATEHEAVMERFRQGSAFIMDCEPETGLEPEPEPDFKF